MSVSQNDTTTVHILAPEHHRGTISNYMYGAKVTHSPESNGIYLPIDRERPWYI